ncbi:MAG: MFS transporter [Candidatus Bathyarchaeota archaeon]
MNQVRIVILVQIINSFVSGVLTVVLPLMMLERNIDIATMGFVFAAMPIIFQLGRMVFATVSDFWGRKPFFVLNGCLVTVSSVIYCLAHTPLEFLFGKVVEGVKSGSLWAVNRAFLLEKNKLKWRALVNLRTASYVSSAVGSLLAGFLAVWLFYENTLTLCALLGASVIPFSLLLVREKKKRLSVSKALRVLDFRKKKRAFKIFLALFFVMGLSFGFVSGFVYPLFLENNGFDVDTIGLLLGLQILLAGLVSYFFAGRFKIRKLIFFSGILYTLTLILVGFSSLVIAGVLVVVYGVVEGFLGISQEGILSTITNEESYGTDIGLLWMGHHIGRTSSLAMSGIIISKLGFTAPFLMSALIYIFFYTTAYFILKE